MHASCVRRAHLLGERCDIHVSTLLHGKKQKRFAAILHVSARSTRLKILRRISASFVIKNAIISA